MKNGLPMSVQSNGQIRCVYDETIELSTLGELSIQRGSHVEPDAHGRWSVDLSPVNGPSLGPFRLRSQALEAEHQWLVLHWLNASQS